jgi:hypothetical protein
LLATIATLAVIDHVWSVGVILGLGVVWLALHAFWDCAVATASYRQALEQLGNKEGDATVISGLPMAIRKAQSRYA